MVNGTRTSDSGTRRIAGFTLLELLFALVVLVILAAILLPSLGKARASARIAVCMSNERQLGTATHAYAADFKDAFAAFTWTASPDKPLKVSEFEDLNGVTSPIAAAAAQAVDIIRRRTGRNELALPEQWMPYLRHHPLVMVDYLAARLPEKILACPQDEPLLRWQNGVEAFDRGEFLPQQPAPDEGGKLAPYGTTYQPTISIFDASPEGSRLSQGERSSELVGPGGEALAKSKFTGSRVSKVQAPAQKVLFYHEYGLHEKRPAHFGLDSSCQPLLFIDGSVYQRLSGESQAGWQPNQPRNPAPSSFLTDGYVWNPPTLASDSKGQEPPDRVIGKFRWTRDGLGGADFGGGPNIPGIGRGVRE